MKGSEAITTSLAVGLLLVGLLALLGAGGLIAGLADAAAVLAGLAILSRILFITVARPPDSSAHPDEEAAMR